VRERIGARYNASGSRLYRVRDGVIRKERPTRNAVTALMDLAGIDGVVPILAQGADWYEMPEYGRCLADCPMLTAGQAHQISVELLATLRAIHARGYAHRDVKIENIMLDYDGHPVLIDFQHARPCERPALVDLWGKGPDVLRSYLCLDAVLCWMHSIYGIERDLVMDQRPSTTQLRALDAQIRKAPATGVAMSYQQMDWPGGYHLAGERNCRHRWQIMHPGVAGKTVLDLGCNLGWFTMQSVRDGARRAVGLDRGQNIIRCAREVAALYECPAEFYVCDLNHLTLDWLQEHTGQAAYDVVFCLSVWMHVARREELMAMIRQATQTFYFEALRIGEYASKRDDMGWRRYLAETFPGWAIHRLGTSERQRPIYVLQREES